MEEKNLEYHHINLGRISIHKQVASLMETDNLFHDFVYNCLMMHETGECRREIVDPTTDKKSNQSIKSTHIHKASGVSFEMITNLGRSETSLILGI